MVAGGVIAQQSGKGRSAVAWQDELIELETKLASGALSAEEYRRARDELFAQSQSSSAAEPDQAPAPQQPPQPTGGQTPAGPAGQPVPAPAPQAGQPGSDHGEPRPAAPEAQRPVQQPTQQVQQPTQQVPPAAPPQPPGQQAPGQQAGPLPGQPGGPFPPPFQWGQPGGEAPDSTQIIPPVAADPPGERTQVVRDDPERTQAVSDPERTQSVSPHQQRQQAPQSPGWSDDSPAWANSDSAPVIAPNTTWTKQGPEAFDSGGGGGKRGRLVGTVVAGVLVVALAVVAVIYFTTTGGNNPGNTPTGQAPAAGGGNLPAPTSTAPPLDNPPPAKKEPKTVAAALAKVPGQVRPGGGPLTKRDITEGTFLDSKILGALDEAGFTGGLLKATTSNGSNIGVFAMTVRDPGSATEAAQAYAAVQTEGGIPARREDSQRGVAAFGTADDSEDADQVRRAVYVLYNRVIIIDVGGSDRQQVQQTFQQVLDRQVAFAPPTDRQNLPQQQ